MPGLSHVTHGLGADIKLAARRLLATPFFTVFAVLSLGIGVAVTTTVYSIADGLFWGDVVAREPGRVVIIMSPGSRGFTQERMSALDYADARTTLTSFSDLTASRTIVTSVRTPSAAEIMAGEVVDPSYFKTLGLQAALGRTIQPSDGDARVAVLSHATWRTKFAEDPRVVGQTVRLSAEPFEIIGVAEPDAEAAIDGLRRPRFWVPTGTLPVFAGPSAAGAASEPRDRRDLVVIGRLRPDRTAEQAAAEVAAFASNLEAIHPRRTFSSTRTLNPRRWSARSLLQIQADNEINNRLGIVIVALVALVLVVACTNLANLVLARGTARQHELAVRASLGASRWRLIREPFTESAMVAVGGALCSLIMLLGLRTLLTVDVPIGAGLGLSIQPEVNPTALAVASGALLLSLLVFGLEPAVQLTRLRDVRDELAAGSGGVGLPRVRRQRALLRWQVAISAGFFIIATLFVRHTIAEMRHDTGVDVERVAIAKLNFSTQRWDEARARRALDRVLEELHQDPALSHAAVSAGLPFGLTGQMSAWLGTADRPIRPGPNFASTAVMASPGLFGALGVPISLGRGFDERDHSSGARVAILSEQTARRLFGTLDAVGRPIQVQTRGAAIASATVIGVAGDTDTGFSYGRRGDLVYLPFSQYYDPSVTVTVRAVADPAAALQALRAGIRRADPELAMESSGGGRVMMLPQYVILRGAGVAALSLGALTLLLAMVGLFGIQSHMVERRTREIGVRMAFGATTAHIRRMIVRDGYVPVLQGLALGLFLGLTGRFIVRAYMSVTLDVIDPWMLLVVPVPLLLAAFCACLLPARRASRVDPNVALRHP